VLDFYQQRFRQVHVDEFRIPIPSYAWLRLLTDGRDNLFVVGDDDQSIYGCVVQKLRISTASKTLPDHQVIKLEQNYRSTGTFLRRLTR